MKVKFPRNRYSNKLFFPTTSIYGPFWYLSGQCLRVHLGFGNSKLAVARSRELYRAKMAPSTSRHTRGRAQSPGLPIGYLPVPPATLLGCGRPGMPLLWRSRSMTVRTDSKSRLQQNLSKAFSLRTEPPARVLLNDHDEPLGVNTVTIPHVFLFFFSLVLVFTGCCEFRW